MRELGPHGAKRGKVKRTTISNPAAERAADPVQRRFNLPAPSVLDKSPDTPRRLTEASKGTAMTGDLDYLATVAAEVNDRTRKIHDWKNPAKSSPNSSTHMLPPAESAGIGCAHWMHPQDQPICRYSAFLQGSM